MSSRLFGSLLIALAIAMTTCVFEQVRLDDLRLQMSYQERDLTECQNELQNAPVHRAPPAIPDDRSVPARYHDQ